MEGTIVCPDVVHAGQYRSREPLQLWAGGWMEAGGWGVMLENMMIICQHGSLQVSSTALLARMEPRPR